jgi:hypothetical protein
MVFAVEGQVGMVSSLRQASALLFKFDDASGSLCAFGLRGFSQWPMKFAAVLRIPILNIWSELSHFMKTLLSFSYSFRYVHKLKERMSAWRSFKDKQTSLENLPAAFRDVQGPADPPFAEYSELVDIEEMMDAQFSIDMQRALLAQLLAENLSVDRQLEPHHRA